MAKEERAGLHFARSCDGEDVGNASDFEKTSYVHWIASLSFNKSRSKRVGAIMESSLRLRGRKVLFQQAIKPTRVL